ncbi:MAG: ATP-binding protein [Bacteroidetes bacterium]|nr:ATP-binding protein [Bacteroidota bacterium]
MNAQVNQYTNFTTENGLSNNTVNCLFQDKYGYLWIGTDNGLNKYDGYVFTGFHSNNSDSTSLSNDFIISVAEDTSGDLWIGTAAGGLNLFDRRSQNFKHFNVVGSGLRPIYLNDIASMSPDDSGNIWIHSRSGRIFLFNCTGRTYTDYTQTILGDLNIPPREINIIHYAGNSVLLIATADGLVSYDIKNKRVEVLRHSDDDPKSICNNFVASIFRRRSGELLIGTAGSGLQSFDPVSGKFLTYDISAVVTENTERKINCITEDKENNIIAGKEDEHYIIKIESESGAPVIIRKNSQVFELPPDKIVNVLFVDNNNILWVGHHNLGLGKYNLNPPKFGFLSFNNKITKTEAGRKIMAVCTDDKDNLWMASVDELIFYNPVSEYLKIIDNTSINRKISKGNFISSIVRDYDGNLWIGTEGAGLIKFNTGKETTVVYNSVVNDENGLNSDYIKALYVDRNKTLWIGTSDNGICTFDTKSGIFNAIPITYSDFNRINNDNVSVFYEDEAGNMWIGTYNAGLICYNRNTDKIIRYKFDAGNRNSLSSDKVLSICEDKSGIIWAGTDNGLNEYDVNSGGFNHYLRKDGLIYEIINALIVDNRNNIWMATNNGITKFSIAEKTFRIYNLFDGLQGKEFRQSFCTSSKGEIFFCGTNGVNHFFPDSIKDKPNNSNLLISFKSPHGTVYDGEYLFGQKELNLDYTDNSFTFGFSLLDYTNPSYYTYAYKLDGIDKDWTYTKNIKSSVYTNLEPGNYIFSVKAVNSDDVWTQPVSVVIRISPPFWKTLWFRLLFALTATIIIVSVFNRIYYYRKYNKLLENDIYDKSVDLEKTNLSLQKERQKRKEIKENLKYSEEQYRLIVENTIEAIVIFQDGKVIYTNPKAKQILGHDFENLVTLEGFLDYVHPKDREMFMEKYSSAADENRSGNIYSVSLIRKGHQEIIVEINSAVLPGKETKSVILFIKDITSRKKAEDNIKSALEKEKELSELRSRFISMTSHEFRTPLTSINTSVEILEKFSERITPEQRQNNLIRIQENIQKMKKLLNDVLVIGKSDAGMYKLKLEPTDINLLCSRIESEFSEHLAVKTGHKISFEAEKAGANVLLDKDLIRQVIENLIGNAIKYSPPESTVYFRMKLFKRYIEFSVRDEGIGVPADEKNNLFESFYRASNTKDVPGSGLGLAIVKRAVELHNGKIRVKSEEGKGTEFIFVIPLIRVP